MKLSEIIGAIIGAIVALYLFSGCAALPAVGAITSGGVTLYKSARESGPKVELVVFKAEFNHTIYQSQPCKRTCK